MSENALIHYRVDASSLRGHRWAVELRIARPEAEQTVSLPVWIPGSYLVREFARHLNKLSAAQGKTTCTVEQIDKASWLVHADPRRPLVLRYEVYAFDDSVRTAWLDLERGFFNGTSLLLRAHGHEAAPHTLTLRPPPEAAHWEVATAMTPVDIDAQGFGEYGADNYDELVDHPVEMGTFWSGHFNAGGVSHRFVVAGAPASFDGERLLRDTQKICEAAIELWHSGQSAPHDAPPHRHYVFMLNAVANGYGGLEHRASTALICKRADLPRQGAPDTAAGIGAGYITLLGLISHEYFHTWNVKRLRPSEFAVIDFTRENYTELLWFFEGFTSYYDDLLVRRAGLTDDAAYLKVLTRAMNQVLQAPGRHAQSVAQASFDAWVRFYRPDANTPNSTISYYTKGALVALCFDLTLRRETEYTLDDVMRALWQRCDAGPMRESDVAEVLAELGGRSYAPELTAWVHGTDELPLQELLESQGVQVLEDPSPLAQTLGLRVKKDHGIRIQMVLDGGPAAEAGIAPGDEWLGLEVPANTRRAGAATAEPETWHLKRLDDIPLFAGNARQVTAVVARDQRLLHLPISLPAPGTTLRLAPRAGDDEDDAQYWPGN